MQEIERTEAQEEAIKNIETFLNAQTQSARRSNKTYRGLDKALAAANVATGMFRKYASDEEKALATKFFATYESGGRDATFAKAPSWK